MIRLLHFLLLLALAMQTLPATAAQEFPDEGSTLSGTVSHGRFTFALPPGDWTVVANWKSDATYNGVKRTDRLNSYLVQIDSDRRFVASVTVSSLLTQFPNNTNWNDILCDRKNTLYYNSYSNRFDTPECIRIDHFVQFWRNRPSGGPDLKIFDWLRSNKVQLPATALQVAYRKYVSYDYVWLSLNINPERFGQAPAVKTKWTESEWEPLTYDNDPKRKAFVDNLKRWSESLIESSRATLKDRKPKAAPLPSLDELRVK